MKLKLLITAALALQTLTAASFDLAATFTFTPLSGSLPAPAASSVRGVMIGTPSTAWTYCGAPGTNGSFEAYCPDTGYEAVAIPTSQYTYLADTAAPTASEVTSLTNALNTAQITWAASGYGFSTTGSFTDLGTAVHGPLSYQNLEFSSTAGMAGTLTMDFDCQLVTASANEAATCFVNSLILTKDGNGANRVVIAPEAVILDLRGAGTARWNDGVITASGSNYTLRIGFNSHDNSIANGVAPHAPTSISSTIVVSGGLVSAVTKTRVGGEGTPFEDPFVLPTVGSSGTITITAPVPSVTYDYTSQAGSDPTQLLIFAHRADAFRF